MNIINYLIFNIIYIKLSFSYLIFPFKTRFSNIPNIDKNITSLFRSLIDNHIFIELYLGNPKQIIEVFLRSNTPDFYISEKNKSDKRTSCPDPYIYDVGSDLTKFFDKFNSTSLNITKEGINSYPEVNLIGNVSYDNFYFINDKKENINSKMKFILYKSTLGYMPGVIGLQAILENDDKKYNFIDQLKSNDVINTYYWMINYTSDYEGNFIIGEQPHIFDSDNFQKDELYFSYPFLYDDFYNWGLPFNSITFNGVNLRQFHDNTFDYELNYIKGGIELEQLLDKYYNEYILNGTCFKENIKYPYPPNIFFYCKKNLYENNMKYFPPLKLFQFEFNYTFELNYKDLFIEKNDKIILLIFFDEMKFDWHFGKPFLRKYSFLMNQDTKIIGFYKNNNKEKNEEKKDNNEYNKTNWYSKLQIILFIFLIIIAVILLVISGIFIGIHLFKKKKSKKYSIEEEYDYTPKNDGENN